MHSEINGNCTILLCVTEIDSQVFALVVKFSVVLYVNVVLGSQV